MSFRQNPEPSEVLRRSTQPAEPSRLRLAMRSLRHRNFRLFFGGQLISLVGTWMQNVAQAWLVYRLTGSSLLLGAVGFAGQIPVFLMAPIGGVVADRYHRHRVVKIGRASGRGGLRIAAAVAAWQH